MKNTVKVQRAIHCLTQSDLAQKIGVSRQTINAIENGRYTPSTELALKMAVVFNVTVNELFELEDSDWD